LRRTSVARSWTTSLLAVLVVFATVAVFGVGAAAPPAGATSSPAFVPASLLAQAQNDPSATFSVIVQGSGPGNAKGNPVAGAAAYLLALHPAWTPDQVKGALMLTAKALPAAQPLSVGVGEVDAAKAGDVTSPPNPNSALNKFLTADPNGGSTPVFDAASRGSAARTDASWGSASWGSASWGAASWGDTSVADNADGEVGQAELLTPLVELEAEAELGITINPDGSLSHSTAIRLL
jgi:hypothetical protein